MAKALFLVIESLDRWWVDFEGAASGPFDSIQAAAMHAQQIARAEARESKRRCDVMAPDNAGKFWRIWSSEQERAVAAAPEPDAAAAE